MNGQEAGQLFEKKVECVKQFAVKLFNLCQLYWHLAVETVDQLWLYNEFRLGIYVFGLLSFIPIMLFLLFISLVILLTTVLTSFLWTLSVFLALTIGLVLLVPVLCGFALIAGLIIMCHYAYHLLVHNTTKPKVSVKQQ
ncbi:MAG: hypothetical protein EXX96DRAFT_344538 [Benjaminiella poitrasii]|nr:MAG: hypothetical protein EXX96DRAFT_344538 [Benjaminiella poitrasii]